MALSLLFCPSDEGPFPKRQIEIHVESLKYLRCELFEFHS